MDTQQNTFVIGLAMVILVAGLLLPLVLLIGVIIHSGVVHWTSELWLHWPFPVGIANFIMALVLRLGLKGTKNRKSVRLANTNIVAGVLDILLGFGSAILYIY